MLVVIVIVTIFLYNHTRPESPVKKTNIANERQFNTKNIKIGSASLSVEIADSPSKWSKGLANRTSLSENSGMMFLFPKKELRVFWMKDTLIPLDIIWIADRHVVGIDRMFPELNKPLTALKRYISVSAIDTVIEVPLNWTKIYGVNVGDEVIY